MNTFSEKITQKQAEEIKSFMANLGATFDSVQYSAWRAKTSSFQAIYYTSGKLLIQGKNVSDIASKVNEILGKNSLSEKKRRISYEC